MCACSLCLRKEKEKCLFLDGHFGLHFLLFLYNKLQINRDDVTGDNREEKAVKMCQRVTAIAYDYNASHVVAVRIFSSLSFLARNGSS